MRELLMSGIVAGVATLGALGSQESAPRLGTKPFAEWVGAWCAATPADQETLLDGVIGVTFDDATLAATVDLLKDADPKARELACRLLHDRYLAAAELEPLLQPLLADAEPRVRFHAARSCIALDWKHAPPAAWEVLLGFARDVDPAVRLAAVWELVPAANVEPRVVDLLLGYAHVDELELRRAAIEGLCGAEDDRSREAQRAALSDPDAQIRVRAAHSLAYAGGGSDEVAAVLLQLVGSADLYVRDTALSALGQLGVERATDLAPALIASLHDAEAGARYQAAFALGALGSDGAEFPDAVPSLVELTKDEHPDVRGAAAFALGNVGATADVAVPALAPLIQDPSAETRGYALRSLRNAGPEIVLALPQLIAALKDPDPNLRACVAQLLAMGGAGAKDAVAALTGRLADPSLNARLWSAYALREIGVASAAAAPELVKSLGGDPEPKMRVEAARTLAAIGPLAGSAADALLQASRDPDAEVELWSLFALGEIGVKSEGVLARLRGAAAATDPALLAEANKALAKLGEAHDETAIANAPAVKEFVEPVTSPIAYDGFALLLSDADGAAIVDFLDEFGGVDGATETHGVRYRFRYLARGQEQATSGEDEVREVSRQLRPGFGEQDAIASRIQLAAGPLRVNWSFRAPGSGFVYWRPETLRVELGDSNVFDTLDLRRLIR